MQEGQQSTRNFVPIIPPLPHKTIMTRHLFVSPEKLKLLVFLRNEIHHIIVSELLKQTHFHFPHMT